MSDTSNYPSPSLAQQEYVRSSGDPTSSFTSALSQEGCLAAYQHMMTSFTTMHADLLTAIAQSSREAQPSFPQDWLGVIDTEPTAAVTAAMMELRCSGFLQLPDDLQADVLRSVRRKVALSLLTYRYETSIKEFEGCHAEALDIAQINCVDNVLSWLDPSHAEMVSDVLDPELTDCFGKIWGEHLAYKQLMGCARGTGGGDSGEEHQQRQQSTDRMIVRAIQSGTAIRFLPLVGQLRVLMGSEEIPYHLGLPPMMLQLERELCEVESQSVQAQGARDS